MCEYFGWTDMELEMSDWACQPSPQNWNSLMATLHAPMPPDLMVQILMSVIFMV